MKPFYAAMTELFEAMEDCRAKQRWLACLVLFYSTLDVLSSLEPDPSGKVKTGFTNWVGRYVLKSGRFQCAAIDLYGARCGILHQLTAESDLSRRGEAKRVLYAWDNAKLEDLEETARRMGVSGDVFVHMSELLEAAHRGVFEYLEEVKRVPERAATVEQSVARWLVAMDGEKLNSFLKMSDGKPAWPGDSI